VKALSPKGMHRVAVGDARSPGPRERADPGGVASRELLLSTDATLSGWLGARAIYAYPSGVARRYVQRSPQGRNAARQAWDGSSTAPLIFFPFVIYLVGGCLSHHHGFVGCLSDFFVIRVGQFDKDFPRLLRTDTADGFDGREQQVLGGCRSLTSETT
jgi:hypothetical protein